MSSRLAACGCCCNAGQGTAKTSILLRPRVTFIGFAFVGGRRKGFFVGYDLRSLGKVGVVDFCSSWDQLEALHLSHQHELCIIKAFSLVGCSSLRCCFSKYELCLKHEA
uniref:Uncharacterized protein n=1 Tax=Phlegmariurus squarrosus TaxID=73615 RepID=H9M872_PHLSQ|nr:hypothetical protein HusqMp96 [Phlegmariurus squarrosus]AEV55779.1 hypothetical protein HusqMp96 [Phlegmariurus squarrosus]